jgi:predicted PhzF superfamily epimerase YddE/YHI9
VPTFHLLRVFCDADGSGGNPLAVFLDGAEVPDGRRQAVAAALGYSETVFVDDRERGALRIFTPAVELPFAEHPTVGAAWLLATQGQPPSALRTPAGVVDVRLDGDRTFVAADPSWSPAFEWHRLGSAAAVDALTGPPATGDLVGAWAWLDEEAGAVRARVFPVGLGILEDEATGSAATLLCASLGRAIEIRQGRGSLIVARPVSGGRVEIGGHAVLDAVREHAA